MFCKYCGNEMPENVNVCPNCGNGAGIAAQPAVKKGNKTVVIVLTVLLVIAAIVIAVLLIKNDSSSSIKPEGYSQSTNNNSGSNTKTKYHVTFNFSVKSSLLSKYDVDITLNSKNVVTLKEKESYTVSYDLEPGTYTVKADGGDGAVFQHNDSIAINVSKDMVVNIEIAPGRTGLTITRK